MGYDRIILIVAVVMCRTAVLQVLSQTTITTSTEVTTKPTTVLPKTSTESSNTSSRPTFEPGCDRTDIFPNCSYCDSSDIYNDTWICFDCAEGYKEQDNESCSSFMPNDTSKECCIKTPKDKELNIPLIIGASVGGGCAVVIIIVIVIVAMCLRRKRRKRSRAEPPRPPPVDTNRVHIDADGIRFKFDKKGNKVFDVDVDVEMDVRRPMPPPLDVPHPPLPDDSNQVYDNDPDQLRIENTGRQRQPPRLPGQLHLPKPPLPSHQKPLKPGEPPRAPPPVPVKDQGPALRPPNPPPKPATPSPQRSKQQPPATPKPKPKPAVPRKGGQSTSPSPQGDFQDTYEIPDADKHEDFGETYDDVASDNNALDWQESYDDVGIPHQDQAESDGEDYEPVPDKSSLQSPPQSPFGHITQESIIREYGDDKLYQNQPVLDSKTKTSYRYRNLAMTKGEKIESEAPYLVKR